MKHAFSNVTSEGLIVAITAMTEVARLDDNAQPQKQAIAIGRHNQTGHWIISMGDTADGEPCIFNGERVFSSPELSHAIYGALVDHYAAFNVFKERTGWSA